MSIFTNAVDDIRHMEDTRILMIMSIGHDLDEWAELSHRVYGGTCKDCGRYVRSDSDWDDVENECESKTVETVHLL